LHFSPPFSGFAHREELEAHYQDLHLEYTALLKDYRRQQVGAGKEGRRKGMWT
jgi:hypothetical protein